VGLCERDERGGGASAREISRGGVSMKEARGGVSVTEF
jgi:hypothetical protein